MMLLTHETKTVEFIWARMFGMCCWNDVKYKDDNYFRIGFESHST